MLRSMPVVASTRSNLVKVTMVLSVIAKREMKVDKAHIVVAHYRILDASLVRYLG